MDGLQQAVSILKRSREILADRLIESLVGSEEEFIADAAGESYMNEISTVYDDVCGKLGQVNSMLANLPANSESADKLQSALGDAEPLEANAKASEKTPAVNFGLFGRQVMSNDIEAAGSTLSQLMGIDNDLGLQCANAFHARLLKDPQTIQKAMGLYGELAAGNHNQSLMILYQCFGLQGIIAVQALETLRATQFDTDK